jgi:hypothetical protein
VDPTAGLDAEKILHPTGIRTPTSLSSSPYLVAVLTELSRLTLSTGVCEEEGRLQKSRRSERDA